MPSSPDPRAFAQQAHGAQTYGEQPYVVHLDAVAELVGADAQLQAVAYLHDVLEDTDVTAEMLAERFGPVVTAAVELLTDPHAPTRAQRKALLHTRLHAASSSDASGRAALVVKAADRLANVRACVATGDRRLDAYRREHPAFRSAAHRAGLCDALWAELDEHLSVVE